MVNTGKGRIAGALTIVALASVLVLAGAASACQRGQTATTTAATTAITQKPTTAAGPSAADFYKVNLVRIVVNSSAGGGSDIFARLFANYWTEVTGGQMIVENKSGGGGVTGLNIAWQARPDGLTIGLGIPGGHLFRMTLEQNPAMEFDIKRMQWIGWANAVGMDGLAVGAKSPYNSAEDVMKSQGLKLGESGNAQRSAALIEILGLKDAKIVFGYGGQSELSLASAKGEIDGYVMNSISQITFAQQGFLKRPLLSMGFTREDYLPDVPAITEVVKLSPEQEVLLRVAHAISESGQVLWFQPAVPKERVDFVREVFKTILAKESYRKQAEARWAPLAEPITGKELVDRMEKTLAVATPEKFSELNRLVEKYRR